MSERAVPLFDAPAPEERAVASVRRRCRIRPIAQCPDCGGPAGMRPHSYGRCDDCTRHAYVSLGLDIPEWLDGGDR